MTRKRPTSSRAYIYDQLDRLVEHPSGKCFYQQGRLVTERDGTSTRSMLRIDDQPLAVQSSQALQLLASDQPGSVLRALGAEQSSGFAYTPYGYSAASSTELCLLGFNGERLEPLTTHYLVGSYRLFNTQIMRCNSPDNLSPFGRGGLNAYASYLNNPIRYVDRDGHSVFSGLARLLGFSGRTVGGKAATKVPELFKQGASTSKLGKISKATRVDIDQVLSQRISAMGGLSQGPATSNLNRAWLKQMTNVNGPTESVKDALGKIQSAQAYLANPPTSAKNLISHESKTAFRQEASAFRLKQAQKQDQAMADLRNRIRGGRNRMFIDPRNDRDRFRYHDDGQL
ncbi:RHS repeat-associated core domain-containing protein [Pseudomonas sp. SDI]|uniref:RHS repeat-associated core domain-containing protein n=1 Tax=Pseudomonas sp. SDI TaxID=2170734 RepID=UPI0021146C44|nr:RHS repeat-associated core domain-containing protein [Pseudomonas sp. SDI]